MYIFAFSSVLFIQKLQPLKNLSWLSVDLGKKKETRWETRCVKFENRNNFIATERKIQVSHSLVRVFQWVFILLIFINNTSQPVFFLTQHYCDMVLSLSRFLKNLHKKLRLFLVTSGVTLKMRFLIERKTCT